MKLVDWDKVKISYDKQVSGTIIEPIYNIKVEAPIVKAIPIEWINDWLNKGRNAKYFIPMMKMVEQWEKENESRSTESNQ